MFDLLTNECRNIASLHYVAEDTCQGRLRLLNLQKRKNSLCQQDNFFLILSKRKE